MMPTAHNVWLIAPRRQRRIRATLWMLGYGIAIGCFWYGIVFFAAGRG